MALQINPTPVLHGDAAADFLDKIASDSAKVDLTSEVKKVKSILAKAKI